MEGAAQTNEARPHRIVDRLERILGPVSGCHVALLGLAFKPGTDDIRYSPAIALGKALADRGASVLGHDEAVGAAATQHLGWLSRAGSPSEAVDAADLVVLATEWPSYLQLDWEALSARARRPALYDGRNVLDRSALLRAGWRIVSVGRRDKSAEAEVLP
jgi:UDPglucose 6-dehydrogenase